MKKPVDMPEHLSLAYVKDKHIDEVLASVGGNKTQAAKILRVSRKTLFRALEARRLRGELPESLTDSGNAATVGPNADDTA